MCGVAPKNTTPGPPADCNQGSVFIILHVYQIVKIQIQQPQPVSKEIYRAITCRIVIAGKRLVAVCSSLRLRPRRVLSDRESVTLKRCVQRVNDLPSLSRGQLFSPYPPYPHKFIPIPITPVPTPVHFSPVMHASIHQHTISVDSTLTIKLI